MTTNTNKISALIDSGNLINAPEYFEEILIGRGLRHYLNAYLESVSSLDGEIFYHGLTHTKQVVLAAFEGAVISSMRHDEIKHILLAALFHDFMHTRGKDTEKVNINRAVKGLEYVVAAVPDDFKIEPEDLVKVIDIIRSTAYPYSRSRTKLTTSSFILRDADRMCYYANDEIFLDLMCGLANENVYKLDEPTSDCFIRDQRQFTQTVRWETKWAYLKYQQLNWPAIAAHKTNLLRKHLRIIQDGRTIRFGLEV